MALSSLFFTIGAKIIGGIVAAAKGALAAISKTVFAKFVYGGLMMTASSFASKTALSALRKGIAASPTYQSTQYTQTNPDMPLPIVYGTVRTAGNLIWQDVQPTYCKKVIAFAEGEIENISDIRINDIPLEQLNHSVEKFYGKANQTIANLIKGTTQLEKAAVVGSLKNVAYLALRVNYTAKVSSNYNLTAVVKGKKVRIYRTEDSYYVAYSENPAWVLLDFLTSYNGLGLALNESGVVDNALLKSVFDIQSFIEAAAYCDEKVDGIPRFTFNMIFDSQTSVRSLLDEIYRSCRGGLFFKNGQLQFKIDKQEAVSKVFTQQDISNEVFKAVPSEEQYDILKCVYISPEHEWQKVEAFAEIPEYRNGTPVEYSVNIFSCTNFKQASRLAWYYSNCKVLQPYYGSFDTDFRAYDLEVGDVITFDSILMGVDAYKVKVTQVTDDGAGTYTVNWQTYDERLYQDKLGSLEPRVLITKKDDLLAYPSDVENFNVVQKGEFFNFAWSPTKNPADTYEIRLGASWHDSKILSPKIPVSEYFSKIENKGLHRFWIKAWNGYNYSKNATSDLIYVDSIPTYNLFVLFNMLSEPNYLSSDLTNCSVYQNCLCPSTDVLWPESDGVTTWGDWDEESLPEFCLPSGMWGSKVVSHAEYLSKVLDIGKVLTSVISVELESFSEDTENSFQLLWRHSEDATDWSEWKVFTSAEISARYFQFKLPIEMPNNLPTYVTKFVANIDVPDKDKNYTITISNPSQGYLLDYSDVNFTKPPSIVATVTNSINAYAVTKNKTSSSVKIFAIANDGTNTAATIDVQVKGY